jgi:hypothetical protein
MGWIRKRLGGFGAGRRSRARRRPPLRSSSSRPPRQALCPDQAHGDPRVNDNDHTTDALRALFEHRYELCVPPEIAARARAAIERVVAITWIPSTATLAQPCRRALQIGLRQEGKLGRVEAFGFDAVA